MNFIIQLLKSDNYDTILIVVDRLIKMKHVMVCHEICDTEEVAQLFVQDV